MALLIFWLPSNIKYHTIGKWNQTVVWMLRVFCGVTHEIKGLENLPKPPYIICANHQSAWETIAFYGIFPRTSFVVKKSLLFIPFFGWGLYIAMDPIPINRQTKMSAFRAILANGKEKLANKIVITIFPEGTRIKVGERKEFLPSAAMLAVDSKVPIVPVAHNSGTCWPNGIAGLLKKPGTINVSIGPAITTDNLKVREATNKVQQWIHNELDQIGG